MREAISRQVYSKVIGKLKEARKERDQWRAVAQQTKVRLDNAMQQLTVAQLQSEGYQQAGGILVEELSKNGLDVPDISIKVNGQTGEVRAERKVKQRIIMPAPGIIKPGGN